MQTILLPPDSNAETVQAMASRLSETVGSTHSDVLFPALAVVFATALLQLPNADAEQALNAFATNVRGLHSLNARTSAPDFYK